MAVRGREALALLDAVGNDNAKGEYYLTDIVAIARGKGLNVTAIEVPVDNVIGINNRAELAEAEAIWQNRKRREMMLAGVTLIAPETVFFSHDTLVEADVIIEPNVFFGPGVHIASGALIHSFSHMEGANVGPNAEIGPFARLRPGAKLGEETKVGNFCEVKNADVRKGRSPAITTATTNTRRSSAKMPLSAPIPLWWPRWKSATTPISLRAARSPTMFPLTHWLSVARDRKPRRVGERSCGRSMPPSKRLKPHRSKSTIRRPEWLQLVLLFCSGIFKPAGKSKRSRSGADACVELSVLSARMKSRRFWSML
jgi:hypothetical protein